MQHLTLGSTASTNLEKGGLEWVCCGAQGGAEILLHEGGAGSEAGKRHAGAQLPPQAAASAPGKLKQGENTSKLKC